MRNRARPAQYEIKDKGYGSTYESNMIGNHGLIILCNCEV